MKCLTLQMIAIVCIFSVGLLTVTPFVQMADADGASHSYTVPVTYWHVYYCAKCYTTLDSSQVGSGSETRTHPDGSGHCLHSHVVVSAEPCGYCDSCDS